MAIAFGLWRWRIATSPWTSFAAGRRGDRGEAPTLGDFLLAQGLSRKKRQPTPPSRSAPTSRRREPIGMQRALGDFPNGFAQTRPGRGRTWPGVMAGLARRTGGGGACPMAAGQPRSLPPCVTTGSPRPAFSMARSTAQAPDSPAWVQQALFKSPDGQLVLPRATSKSHRASAERTTSASHKVASVHDAIRPAVGATARSTSAQCAISIPSAWSCTEARGCILRKDFAIETVDVPRALKRKIASRE